MCPRLCRYVRSSIDHSLGPDDAGQPLRPVRQLGLHFVLAENQRWVQMVVCTLRVLDGVWRGYPEAGYFLDCLIGYPTSGLTPATIPELSPEERLMLFIVGPDAMEQKTNGTIVIPCRNEEPD